MRRVPVAAVLAAEALALAAALLLVADFRAHRQSELLGGVNIWGYRGPVVPQKGADEIRIAVQGGDLAFGWGVAASETLAPNLRMHAAVALDRSGRARHRVTAVNLGAMGLPPSGYAAHLERHRDLRPDVICVYADPARAGHGTSVLPRGDSAISAATGYVPMLPLVLVDKGRSMHSAAVEQAGRLLESIDRTMYGLLFDRGRVRQDASYTDAIEAAVRAALGIASGVVVVAPPYSGTDEDATSHSALVAMVGSTFHDDPRVRFVDLAAIPELTAGSIRLDGVNFSAGGHARVAQHVAPAVIDLVQARVQ